MALVDVLAHYGAKAANFADLGGSAIHEQIDALLYLLEHDRNVNVIFINCYGGILNVDKVVATLRLAIKNNDITKPLVIRLKGNKSEGILDMLPSFYERGMHFEQDLDKAVALAIKLAKKHKLKKDVRSKTVNIDPEMHESWKIE